jgi:hypothetical protein
LGTDPTIASTLGLALIGVLLLAVALQNPPMAARVRKSLADAFSDRFTPNKRRGVVHSPFLIEQYEVTPVHQHDRRASMYTFFEYMAVSALMVPVVSLFFAASVVVVMVDEAIAALPRASRRLHSLS